MGITIEKYIPLAKSAAYRYGGAYFHLQDPGDIYGVCYESLVRSCRLYDGRGNITGWINYNIFNAVKEFIRKTAYIRARSGWISRSDIFISIEDIDPLLLSVNGHMIKRMEQRQYIDWLMAEAKLTQKERWRIRSYYYDDLLQREIAEIEGVTEATVSLSIKKALNKMKKKLCLPLSSLV